MKQGNIKKKFGSLLLAATMIVTSFPVFSSEVHAAELPDNKQFAEKEDLKKFDTDDTNDNGENPAKVYFGQNGSGSAQAWWIAGSQNTKEDHLTLFAASPLATTTAFETKFFSNKPYDSNWNCTYDNNPESVPPNHYGASPLKKP